MAGDLDRVRVRAGGRPVAEHPRVWARGTTIADDPSHVETAAPLRKQFNSTAAPLARPRNLTRDLDGAAGLGVAAFPFRSRTRASRARPSRPLATEMSVSATDHSEVWRSVCLADKARLRYCPCRPHRSPGRTGGRSNKF